MGSTSSVRGADLWLPRPEWFGQNHDRAHADDAAEAHERPRGGQRHRCAAASRARAADDCVALQEAGLDELQTGRELLELQAALFGMRGRKGHERAAELLRIVDLEEAADRRIGGYSGGMRRRLDLAAALVHRPKVVFLDEPTTGLDPVSRDAVWRYVRELNSNDGVTFPHDAVPGRG